MTSKHLKTIIGPVDQFLFIGRDKSLSNPGSPSHDPDFEKKSINLALRFCRMDDDPIIISPQCNHSGIICTLKDGQLHLGDRSPTTISEYNWNGTSIQLDQIPKCSPVVLPVPGDAVVIKSLHPTRLYVLQLRTRDCTPLIGKTKDGIYFTAHLSAETLFGWTSAKNGQIQSFKGSILHRLFKLVDPTKSQVFIGPSISGIKSDCWCYEYTETSENPDGLRLIGGILEEYPKLDPHPFCRMRPEDGKMDIDWGNLVVEVLNQHGVANINTQFNDCTQCNPFDFYSYRVSSKSSDSEDQALLQMKIGNIAMIVTPRAT